MEPNECISNPSDIGMGIDFFSVSSTVPGSIRILRYILLTFTRKAVEALYFFTVTTPAGRGGLLEQAAVL